MHAAIDIAPLGELANVDTIVRLAVAAEAAGWDGISTWDSLGTGMGGAADPFVALAAVAGATTRLRLIASVIAFPRRRPQLVAQAAATLDGWSHGRLVLGIGAGGDPGDFEPFGEPFDAAGRVRAMDEAAALVDAYLRGEAVEHRGDLFSAHDATVGPRASQRPRPPIWLGGMKPGALRRAARWDGWIAVATSEDGSAMALPPDAFGRMADRVRAERDALGLAGAPCDIAVFGFSGPAEATELAAGYERAGATWWLESLSPMRGPMDALLDRIEAGPPATATA